ncbi:hypothetical protein [Chelatococcus sp. YT9]|uniref:hypothetical protein n=1 Tax=Chelatococcus sp. YT9 TaxID=2835635 RepID=UPI001BCD6299|nr:hypothetical protein [Chelatococcus sp. YT9]MBS7701466.1 hypothetical protein [Chelatococcus sp. YT9]
MDAKITPFPFHATARNRALAKLYQPEAAVLQAGIRAEIDRGSSDEGDPWVVFVRPGTGEIIAHVAIIDGEVVADSPAFSRLMRGQDIKEILDRLVSRLKATGYNRPSATVTNLGIVAAAIALASFHLSDADAAWWSPIDPGAVAELTKDMSLVEAIAVITAARVVQELPTLWFAGGSDNNHPVEAPTIPETPEPTQPQHIEAPLQKVESAGEKIRFPAPCLLQKDRRSRQTIQGKRLMSRHFRTTSAATPKSHQLCRVPRSRPRHSWIHRQSPAQTML